MTKKESNRVPYYFMAWTNELQPMARVYQYFDSIRSAMTAAKVYAARRDEIIKLEVCYSDAGRHVPVKTIRRKQSGRWGDWK